MNLIFILLFAFLASHGDEGPGVCPNGRAVAAASDDGGYLDPNGLKARGTIDPDGGGAMDPNGVHTSAVTGDKGLGVDPNG